MIFVTIGTHEQPFNRLLEYVDRYTSETGTEEKVICQSGYSTYIPKNFKTRDFIKHDDMEKYINEARVIITHGGPSSFIPALAKNKYVIIIPREEKYNEHINNHQLNFCYKIAKQNCSIILARTYEELRDALAINQINKAPFSSHNATFCEQLEELIQGAL